jgi:three-Cys-motif partner protein
LASIDHGQFKWALFNLTAIIYSRHSNPTEWLSSITAWGFMSQKFFEKATPASKQKIAIVSDYFAAWSNIMFSQLKKQSDEVKLGYLDLFSGKGRYEDGTESTPLLIMKQIIATPSLAASVATKFNDSNPEFARELCSNLNTLPGIDMLRYKPVVTSNKVDEKTPEAFKSLELVPTLLFADPCGFSGLSLELINAILKDFGSDCLFFLITIKSIAF